MHFSRRHVLIGCSLALILRTEATLCAALLASTDFEPTRAAATHPTINTSPAIPASAALKPAGTIDRYQGQPGLALVLTADFSTAGKDARVAMATAAFAVTNDERDLAKLTIGFDLCLSEMRPVRVDIASLDRTERVTGSRTTLVFPPIAGSFYRFSLDLSQTTPVDGTFDPRAPKIQLSFAVSDRDGAEPVRRRPGFELKLDNVSYTSPAYYVSPHGNDSSDGRTEATPFASIQHAVDVAVPGDVILAMEGTYLNSTRPDLGSVARETVNAPVWRPWWAEPSGAVVRVAKAGRPDAWIVVRSYPGQHPRIHNTTGWAAFKVELGVAYVEIRDLILQGNAAQLSLAEAQADGAVTERQGWRYYGDAQFNNNGIIVDGRATTDPGRRAHHLRFIGNTVFDFPAGGIIAIGADYVTTAHNTVYENVHLTRWGASGISYLRASNFDESTGHKMFVIANRTFRNRCYVPWVQYENDARGQPVPNAQATPSPLSDGNGIIIDVNRRRGIPSESAFDRDYTGRTLVANNLSYGNGGGGIVLTTVQHVDVINNTVYGNVQTPELAARGWGDLMLGGPSPGSGDVTVLNNIVVSTVARSSIWVHPLTQPQPLLLKNNLCYGAPITSTDWPQVQTVTADPLFSRASLDSDADFHLQASSPALAAGTPAPARLVPIVDLEGNERTSEAVVLGALMKTVAP